MNFKQYNQHVLDYYYRNVTPMYDSELLSTRIYWRTRFEFSIEVANDPRPLMEVLKEVNSNV